MIDLSERELCALIKGVAGSAHSTKIITRTKTEVYTDMEENDPVFEEVDSEEIEEEENISTSPESATVIAANVGGPFQAEIQRALMEVLR
jgi:hypothetical protein